MQHPPTTPRTEPDGGAPVGDVAEAEGDGVEVKGAVLEGQALCVALHPRQRPADPVVVNAM